VRGADLPVPGEVATGDGEPPLGGERDVERRSGRQPAAGHDRADQRADPAGEPGRHGERVVGGGPDDVDHLAGPGDRLGNRVHDEAGIRRLGPRHPQLVGHLAGRGRRVEKHLPDVDRRDAVDHRLVGLRDDREAAVGEPLDEVDLPQRAVRVERPRHQPGYQLGELGGRPGPG
jgi:hypothetical protein